MMQKSSFLISKVAQGDIPAVAALERECFSSPWSEDALRDTMNSNDNIFLVAKEEGVVCGYVGCYYVIDEGYITNVAVSERFRRRGVARALINELICLAESAGLSFVTLEVRSLNSAARKLYEGLGFKEVGCRPHFYENPTDDAILMTCYINKNTCERK